MVGRCHEQNKKRIIWQSVFATVMLSKALVFYKNEKRNGDKATGQWAGLEQEDGIPPKQD